MALQNFIDKSGPVISAAWLNAVDILKFTVFGDATTKANARIALTSDAAFEVANGGTGQRTLKAFMNSIGLPGYSTTVASASSMDLGAADTHCIWTTGSANITSFGSSANTNFPYYMLRPTSGAPKIIHSANIITPGNADIQLSTDDQVLLYYVGSGVWKVLIQYPNYATRIPWTDVPSAATVDLGALTGSPRYINITGTTGISSFGSNGNTLDPEYTLYFQSGLTITGGAGLTLPVGGTTMTVAAGDTVTVMCVGASSWQIRAWIKKTGASVIKGSFTPTWTGFSSGPSGVVNYVKSASSSGDCGIVTLQFQGSHSGTSNSTSLSFTGLPTNLYPDVGSSDQMVVPVVGMKDNGVLLDYPCLVTINYTGTVTFSKTNSSANWTSSGSKGFAGKSAIVYPITNLSA